MSTLQSRRRFLVNAISSSLQAVVVAVTLFFLYRFLLRTIPVEHIGLWSVIFAAASVGKLAEMGISAGVVKFVASWLARNEKEEAARCIRTAASATTIGIGLCLGIGYLVSPWILPLFVGQEHSALAASVLGLALLSFWLGSVASVFQSALDGCHRMDQRSAITIATTLLHFALCLLLTPSMGLQGLGISQVIQSLATLVINQVLLQRTLPELRWKFWGWSRQHFRELLAYGVNAQLASVSITLMSEPITKAFISSAGGLGFVAYYDMATRMITQLRSVILSAYQALVPMVSDLHERQSSELIPLYRRAANAMTMVAVPLFAAIAGFAPLVSVLWIGHDEPAFVYSSIILSVGWCINTIIVPAYMMNLGMGVLRWNTWSHIVIGLVNTVLGYVLIRAIGPLGAVLAWSIALCIGSALLLYRFHHENAIQLRSLVDRPTIALMIASACLSVAVRFEYYSFHQQLSGIVMTLLIALTFLLPTAILLLRMDLVSQLRRQLGTHLAKQ